MIEAGWWEATAKDASERALLQSNNWEQLQSLYEEFAKEFQGEDLKQFDVLVKGSHIHLPQPQAKMYSTLLDIAPEHVLDAFDKYQSKCMELVRARLKQSKRS